MSEKDFKMLLTERVRSMIGEIPKPQPKIWDPRVTPELTLEDYKFLYEVGAAY